jgi:putative phosphoribosyl transferase
VRWIRQSENKPKRLIIAIPIAPKPTVNLLEKECNAEVEVVISLPSSKFHSVEQYHQKFQPITDEEVIRIMKDRNLLPSYTT